MAYKSGAPRSPEMNARIMEGRENAAANFKQYDITFRLLSGKVWRHYRFCRTLVEAYNEAVAVRNAVQEMRGCNILIRVPPREYREGLRGVN